jgi:hypothetical protein
MFVANAQASGQEGRRPPLTVVCDKSPQKRHDLSSTSGKLKSSITRRSLHMFWLALLCLAFSAMLIKLGFLSAFAGILVLVVKLLMLLLFVGLIGGAWVWIRRRA